VRLCDARSEQFVTDALERGREIVYASRSEGVAVVEANLFGEFADPDVSVQVNVVVVVLEEEFEFMTVELLRTEDGEDVCVFR
jgi:hypothetical protein